jgi:SAM-dependent methyltransferase
MTTQDQVIGTLTEAEIQVLIAMIELEEPKETPNNNFYRFHPANLEQAARYFRKYREDWTDAYRTLAAKRMLSLDGADPRLTRTGRMAATHWRDERPPIWYWYKEFYLDAPASRTYREFCERLYGRYLCQQGFSDMGQIDRMLRCAGLSPAHRILELGCGTGMLAEYLSDTLGASVHGIDYAPDAITQAQERTASKRDRLSFAVGNMDSLEGDPQSFDAVLSVDSLYMPRSLSHTLARLRDLLAPGGQVLAFYLHFHPAAGPGDSRPADRTPLAQALRQAGFGFSAVDFSRETYELMQRKRALAEELREEFAAEGRSYLYEHLAAESVDPEVPYDPGVAGQSRFLYRARRQDVADDGSPRSSFSASEGRYTAGRCLAGVSRRCPSRRG